MFAGSGLAAAAKAPKAVWSSPRSIGIRAPMVMARNWCALCY